MSSEQCVDNGEICQNCANIITKALQCFFLSPLAEACASEDDVPEDDVPVVLKGKRLWKTRGFIVRVLSENQSSRFGTSPLECYVCFRSSQLAQTAGAKKLTLMNDPSSGFIHLYMEDEAEPNLKSVDFNLILGDEMSAGEQTSARVVRKLPGCTFSKESLHHINTDWIKPCRDGHSSCQRAIPRSYDALPSRIIHVRMECTGERPRLVARLLDVQSLPVNIKYITLSHAWGQHKFLTLTAENVYQFRQSIPLSAPDFNQTFKDALRLTMELGYNYIWIDSLCIIQGSTASDWAYECPRMGSIYCNSELNLSASGFQDPRFGMFGPPRRLVVPPTILYPEGEHIRVIHQSDYSPRNMPLHSRGWVIQENILSPRTLHFLGSGEMLWECNSLLASEVWPDKIPELILYGEDWRCRKRLYADLSTACVLNDSPKGEQKAALPESDLLWPQTRSSQKMRLLTDWYSMIMPQLQVAKLTYILDKFPCVQGIAELFKKAIGCNYLAGHWEYSLIESLDWPSPRFPGMASYNNATPVAPSWSLASVHAKTGHHEFDQGIFPVSEFLGASSTTMSNGPTTVRDLCRLRIKGPAYRFGMDIKEVISERFGRLRCFPGSSWPPGLWRSKDDVTHWDWDAFIDADSHQKYKLEASIQRHKRTPIRTRPNHVFGYGHEYLVTIREDSALFLVILTIDRGDRFMLSGIVTRQVSEESDGPVLERIGHWDVDVPDSERPHFADESFREGMKQSIFYLV